MSPYQEAIKGYEGKCIAYHEDHGVVYSADTYTEVQVWLKGRAGEEDTYIQYVATSGPESTYPLAYLDEFPSKL